MEKHTARAIIFKNDDFIKIVTQSTGMIVYGEPDAPVQYLESYVNDIDLGRAVREALKLSKKVDMDVFNGIFDSGVLDERELEQEVWVKEKYGYKTRRAIYKNMSICYVEASDGRTKIQPTRKTGFDGGFTVKKDTGPSPIYVLETANDAEFGAALREGFNLCE